MARLRVERQGQEPTLHELTGELVIGRGPEATLQVVDTKLSRRHCRVFQELGAWHVEDLGSSNGTRVRGKVIQRHTLSHGDRVEVGLTVLVYEVEQPKALRAPVPTAKPRGRGR